MTAGATAELRLLIIDDDELDRLAVRRCVLQAGLAARVEEAASAAEALERTGRGSYDCILLDYYLPGESGIALLGELRQAAPETPVVIFTGRGDEDVAVELMKSGAADYLPKSSLTPERLASGVRHALHVARAAAARRRAEDELRAEETRFRTLANAIPQLAWMADANGRQYWFNQRWFEYTGATKDDAGEWRRFLHPDHVGRIDEVLRRSSGTGEVWEDTFPLRGRDGTYRWFLSRALPIRGEDGTITGWLGTSTDITERMRVEELRAEAQMVATVRTLAGGVAHEVNNAMTVVLGLSQFLLGDTRVPEDRREDLTQIQRAADRAAAVARQLLSYSRHVAPNPQTIPLDTSVRAMVPMLERLLGTGRQLVASWACPDRVRVDVSHLEQMVANLALNARDAMPTGGTLTLSTNTVVLGEGSRDALGGRLIPPGRYGLLAIGDSGTGMDAATVARIFEPFFTTKPVGLGTGLGLSVLGGLLEGSGGYITVESAPGSGTTFTLYFPLLPPPDGAQNLEHLPDHGGGALAGATVLVVDDEPGVREIAVRSLKASGCRVLEASDGAGALEVVGRHGPPDLVLTDLVMRNVDGAELARRLQARWPGLPVLFMSGHSEDHLHQVGLLDSGTSVMSKPFRPEDLVSGVYAALARGAG